MRAGFVDYHSHVVPSGDDGAQSLAEGRRLCEEAAAHGTTVLFATPHVWPHLTLSADREADIRSAYEELRRGATIELRLGFELTPTRALLRDDPHRYRLDGTSAVLMEVPFLGTAHVLVALAEHVEREELRPVIAHPERAEAVLHDPALARGLAERGWLLQVNSTSLLGRHGPEIAALAWELLESRIAAIVASDGHRETRAPVLDVACELAIARLGDDAISFFDGSALGVTGAASASRAGARGA